MQNRWPLCSGQFYSCGSRQVATVVAPCRKGLWQQLLTGQCSHRLYITCFALSGHQLKHLTCQVETASWLAWIHATSAVRTKGTAVMKAAAGTDSRQPVCTQYQLCLLARHGKIRTCLGRTRSKLCIHHYYVRPLVV